MEGCNRPVKVSWLRDGPVQPMLASAPGSVGAYRADRWHPSWRFYLRQNVRRVETPDQLLDFLDEPGERFCLMLRSDYDAVTAAGYPMHIVLESPGLFVTTGPALRRDRRDAWRSFVVVSNGFPELPEWESSEAHNGNSPASDVARP